MLSRNALASLLLTGCLSLASGADTENFEQQLTPAELSATGIDKLSAAEREALFAAIERYKETGVAAAVAEVKVRAEEEKSQAVEAAVAAVETRAEEERAQAVEAASQEAVAQYKEQEEPGVVTKALELFKREQADKERERFTSVLKGKFRGWEGNTTFYLENGQVWRQTNNDRYYPKAKENVQVAVYKSPSGYYRLQILDDKSAWVTVKRVR